MAQKNTKFSFDSTGIEPDKGIEALPKGDYLIEITDGEIAATRGANGGTVAKFVYTVVTPAEFKGKKVFDNINLKNASAQCQQIGQGQMSAVCQATGIVKYDDLSVFFGKYMLVNVGFGKGEYADRNEVKSRKAPEPGTGHAPAPLPGFAAAPGVGAPPIPGAGAPPIPGAGAPPAAAFPPPGWQPNPSYPGYFWNPATNEQLTETDLRARFAPAVTAPPVPPAGAPPMPTGAPPLPTAPPVIQFPPQGWQANPNAPGWYWNPATNEQKQEAELRALFAAPAAPAPPSGPPMPPGAGAPPVPGGPPMPPVGGAPGGAAPWDNPPA